MLDLSSSTEIASFNHAGKITSLAFSSDNKYLASAATDNFVRVFSLDTQEEVYSYENQYAVYALHFWYEDSELAALRNDHQMLIWSLKDGSIVSQITIYVFLEALSFSRTHNEFAAGDRNGKVRIYDINSVKTRYELNYNAPINRISFDSQTDELIVKSQHGKLIYTRKLQNLKEEKSVSYDIIHYPLLDISEDIQHVVVGGKNAVVFDVKNGIQVAELKHEWYLSSVAISKLGDTVITADEKREIKVWSVKKQVMLSIFKASEDVSSIKFSPDEQYFTVKDKLAGLEFIARMEILKTIKHLILIPDYNAV